MNTTDHANTTVEARWYCVNRDGLATLCLNEQDAREMAAECDIDFPRCGPHRAVLLGDVAAERERHADALRCALEALDYCIEDSAELLNERTVQWGEHRKDRQAAMAATLERHRAVAERLRAMLRA